MTHYPKTIAAACIASLGLTVSAFAQETTLRLHTLVQDPHPYNDMAAFMAEEIAERTDGEIEIQLFNAAQLGDDPSVIGEMGLGTIDLMISSTNNATRQVPEYQIFSIPYMFGGLDDLMARVGPGTPAEAYFRDVYADRGLDMQLLALGGSGTRNMSNRIGPVESLADIEGMQMRTPPSPMISETWAELGTLPVSVAWGELYGAIQTGVADGLESSIAGYSGSRLYEVAPYLAMTGHTIQVNHISMSDRAWNRLSDEQKAMFLEVAAEASAYGIEQARMYETDLVDTLQSENGVTVTYPDITEFQDRLTDLQASLVTDMELEPAQDALFADN